MNWSPNGSKKETEKIEARSSKKSSLSLSAPALLST